MNDPSHVRVRGPLGPYADGFRTELARHGYAVSTAVNQLKLVAHLSRWMTAEGLSAPELVPVNVERYVSAQRAARYRHNLSAQGLQPLLEYLGELGALAAPTPSSPATPIEQLVVDYASYLVAERSLALGRVRYYLRFARLFLSSVSVDGELELGAISSADVSRFVVEQCTRRSVGTARTLVMALRSLLRFLHVAGLSATALVGAVPAVAPWRERSLPQRLSPAAVARLLQSCDRRSATGRRDYAILVVLARLGLRAGEAAALQLGDIDWRHGGSLAEVGELLRQRSAFTQALYAKVDRDALDRVARPWPGARS